jgi:epoxyqueuosine reductase
VLVFLRVRPPVDSGIAVWVYRQMSQDVCPYNVKVSQALQVPAFAPRDFLAGKDALARDLLAMTQEEFRAGFKGSPMKRSKLRGLKRNAAVVLGNSITAEDAGGAEALQHALDDPEPLVREHAASALHRLCLR